MGLGYRKPNGRGVKKYIFITHRLYGKTRLSLGCRVMEIKENIGVG